jgi:predicted choloylglycine hydrolase
MIIKMMQKISTAYYELEGTYYEIGRQMVRLLDKETLHMTPFEIFTEEEINNALALYDKHCPGITDELRGFSDESGIPVQEIAYTWMTYLIPRCSSIALLPMYTDNGHTMIARNYEFGVDEEDFHVYRIAPKGKYAHIGGGSR